MGKVVEIPEALHDALSLRAAGEGLSLSEYLVRELDPLAKEPKAKLLERIRGRQPVDLGMSAADLIRDGREERDRELTARWSSSTRPR